MTYTVRVFASCNKIFLFTEEGCALTLRKFGPFTVFLPLMKASKFNVSANLLKSELLSDHF